MGRDWVLYDPISAINMGYRETIWGRGGLGGGGAGGTRTPCLFNAIEALSQMSYSPMRMDRREDAYGI